MPRSCQPLKSVKIEISKKKYGKWYWKLTKVGKNDRFNINNIHKTIHVNLSAYFVNWFRGISMKTHKSVGLTVENIAITDRAQNTLLLQLQH